MTAVQARANSDLRAANAEVRRVNSDLAAEKARVQERYDLAMEAIKTFHTGVTEDFLLKEDKFKDLRDRLLKSASDFYGKLGALLKGQSDRASRRALGQANFELAELTTKVGRTEAALAAHQQVLAYREVLAREPGADAEARADVGRSLVATARLLQETGRLAEALETFSRVRTLVEESVRGDTTGSARAARSWPRAFTGPARPSLPPAGSTKPSRRTGKRSRSVKTWRRLSPRAPTLSASCPGTTTTSAFCSTSQAGRLKPWRSTRKPAGSSKRWPTPTPISPNTSATWRSATITSASCCRMSASLRAAMESFGKALAIRAEVGRR